MIKRLLVICFTLIVICSLFVSSCAAPTPAPAPKPTPTPAPTQPAKPIELRFHNHFAPTGLGNVGACVPWAKMVEDNTAGKVKVTVYPGSSLMKGTEAYEGTVTGVSDISVIFLGYFPGQFPLTEVVGLPFFGLQSAEQGSKILWGLYEKFPAIQKEWSKVKVLSLYAIEPYDVLTTKKRVTNLEELKGLKIRTPGGPPTKAMEALGASPVMVPMEDTYVALERGTVDGAMSLYESTCGFRFYEVAKYHIVNSNVFTMVFAVTMNLDSWNKLPPDVQKQMEKVSYAYGSAFFGRETFDMAKPACLKTLKEKGYEGKIEEITLTPQELKRWQDICTPQWDAWVKDMEAKGLPGRQVLDEAQALLKKN